MRRVAASKPFPKFLSEVNMALSLQRYIGESISIGLRYLVTLESIDAIDGHHVASLLIVNMQNGLTEKLSIRVGATAVMNDEVKLTIIKARPSFAKIGVIADRKLSVSRPSKAPSCLTL
jgi:sRNA-binding carbon storage regulator CsrA